MDPSAPFIKHVFLYTCDVPLAHPPQVTIYLTSSRSASLDCVALRTAPLSSSLTRAPRASLARLSVLARLPPASSCRTKVVYERLRSTGETRVAGGGFWCVQPLATRGDGAGVPPSRGKDGGAACCSFMAAEKEGVVDKSSSSAESCCCVGVTMVRSRSLMLFFVTKKNEGEKGRCFEALRLEMGINTTVQCKTGVMYAVVLEYIPKAAGMSRSTERQRWPFQEPCVRIRDVLTCKASWYPATLRWSTPLSLVSC